MQLALHAAHTSAAAASARHPAGWKGETDMSTQSIVRALAIAGAALCTFGVWALGTAHGDAAPRTTQASDAMRASTAARTAARAPTQRINLIAAALAPSAAGADP